jgi:hypothetical protein
VGARGEGRVGLVRQAHPKYCRNRLAAERTRSQHVGSRSGDEQADEVLLAPRLAGPDRHQEQERQPFETAPQVEQEAQRGTIAPVRVVHGDEHGRRRGDIHDQAEEPVQRLQAVTVSRARPRFSLDCEHRPRKRCTARQEIFAFRRAGELRLEQLADNGVGEVSL